MPRPSTQLVTATADALAAVAGQYQLVYTYDGCDPAAPWRKYDPASPPFANDLAAVTIGHGYWLRTTQPATLLFAGSRPISTSIALCPRLESDRLPVGCSRAFAGRAGGHRRQI